MSYMKDKFDAILKSYGHDIYLERMNDDGSTSSRMEIWTVRHTAPGAALQNVAQEMPEGEVNTTERTYYFQSEADPFEGDRIWEDPTIWQKTPEDPTRRVHRTTWTIDSALPLRGPGGGIEYWVVGTTREYPN